MNEMLKLIETRRSVRSFKDECLDKETIQLIINAGLQAPSGMNSQSTVIVAVTDEKTRAELSAFNAEIMKSSSDPYYGAPLILLVLGEDDSNLVKDGSCALMNMMLAAHSLGLGAVWINRADIMFDEERGKRLLKQWNLPETLRGVGALAVGVPSSSDVKKKSIKDGRFLFI